MNIIIIIIISSPEPATKTKPIARKNDVELADDNANVASKRIRNMQSDIFKLLYAKMHRHITRMDLSNVKKG